MVVLTVERLLLAVRIKPGMLLNILQYSGQSPATKNPLVEDVKSAEVETPKQVKTSKSPNLKEGLPLTKFCISIKKNQFRNFKTRERTWMKNLSVLVDDIVS